MTTALTSAINVITDVFTYHELGFITPESLTIFQEMTHKGFHAVAEGSAYTPEAIAQAYHLVMRSMREMFAPCAIEARVMIGASGAYACIKQGNTTLDVRLPGGRGAPADLRRLALELREDAARRLARAELMEGAAQVLYLQDERARTS